MGVSTHIVVVYGIEHKWDDKWYEALEKYYETTKQPESEDHFKFFNKWAVMDYMSGENFYIGKLLGYSPDMRWESPYINMSISEKDLPKLQREYILEFNKQFPEFMRLLTHEEWKIHVFAHYI